MSKLSDLQAKLEVIIAQDKIESELFETGEVTQFSEILKNFICEYGSTGIFVLREAIDTRRINTVIAGEILRCIGEIDNPDLLDTQLNTLTHFLSSESLRIRDGAIMGLSTLNTDRNIELLSSAFKTEQNKFLKYVIGKILKRLHRE